ncbi:MAG: cobalamin-binding protein [Rhodospirillales bacterium]|nr:cobalamin-binding protein [Rhodospirillales bacterium]
MAARRVVSLIPSATEIVALLGCADRLVGRSHECDFPLGVERLPVCTRPRLKLEGTSAEIHARVQETQAASRAVYEVFEDRLRALAPDLILTQSQCAVCAVSLEEVEAAVRAWAGRPPSVLSFSPVRLEDVFSDIATAARALAREAEGRNAVQALRARVDAVTRATKGQRPSVACIEWTDPLMAAGNWVPELVAMAGGRDPFGKAGEHAPWISWEALAAADPDAIVFMPCGYGLARTRDDARGLAARPEWRRLSAAGSGRVYVTDGNAYFNRPGPRLVDSLEIMAEILHPDVFAPAHRGAGWVPLAGD